VQLLERRQNDAQSVVKRVTIESHPSGELKG
jgi:hypothetical protein